MRLTAILVPCFVACGGSSFSQGLDSAGGGGGTGGDVATGGASQAGDQSGPGGTPGVGGAADADGAVGGAGTSSTGGGAGTFDAGSTGGATGVEAGAGEAGTGDCLTLRGEIDKALVLAQVCTDPTQECTQFVQGICCHVPVANPDSNATRLYQQLMKTYQDAKCAGVCTVFCVSGQGRCSVSGGTGMCTVAPLATPN